MPPAAINRPPAAPAPQSPWPPHARVIKKRIGGTPSRRRRRKAARAFYAPHAWGALESRPFTTGHPRDCGERLGAWYHREAACQWGLPRAALASRQAVTPCAAPLARQTTPPGCLAHSGIIRHFSLAIHWLIWRQDMWIYVKIRNPMPIQWIQIKAPTCGNAGGGYFRLAESWGFEARKQRAVAARTQRNWLFIG